MEIETREQAAASQRQIETFARLAHSVETAVKELRGVFLELADFPLGIGEAMAELSDAAATIADDARDWAAEDNAAFNPTSKKSTKIEVPAAVLEAVTAVVYWSRSDEGDDGILAIDIPILDEWVTELGLLPPPNPPITDAEWAAWEAGRRYARHGE
jgi:hypothetical protein